MNFMTLDELLEWMASANCIHTSNIEYDSCGNCLYEKVYEKDGRFYKIGFMNDSPCEYYIPRQGVCRDKYLLIQVKKVSWMEYKSDYIPLGNPL